MTAHELLSIAKFVFTHSYIETALWASTTDDDQGTPLDRDYGPEDIAPETLALMIADCERFQYEHADLLAPFDLKQAGHDFWLTRNRHGAGFWDGDYPEPQATQLTDAAHSFGSCTLYVGDDGRIYA